MKKLLRILLLPLLLLISLSDLFSQNSGIIAGKVTNESNEPLSNVSVKIQGVNTGTSTDIEGRFQLKAELSKKYTLSFSSIGFSTKEVTDIVPTQGTQQDILIVLNKEDEVLGEVVIRTSVKKETEFALLSMQRNSAMIADGISAESIKRSPDKNTSEVLKRVSGTSVQDNKFVVVRGLVDRYNIATINNAILPSSEPDRRAFSFDIIPSSMIDNVLIFKTANPDLPGDFAGGVVQVSTKDVPNSNFINIGAGIGYNMISTGKDFNPGYVGSTDYIGFDDGSRELPEKFPSRARFQRMNFTDRASNSKLLKNTYGDRYDGKALPSQSYQINMGKRFDLKNEATLGSILALTYRNSQTILDDGIRSEYDNSSGPEGEAYRYDEQSHRFSTSLGALFNIAYKKGNSKIAFKNLFNRLFENNNLLREGIQYYSSDVTYISAQGSETVIKTLLSSQLEGEHSFKNKSKLTWNLNYALTLRDNPDYRYVPLLADLSTAANKEDLVFQALLRDTYRFFSKLEENAVGGNINYSVPVKLFNKTSTAKFGLFSQYKTRDFSARIFRYTRSPNPTFNEAILTLPLKQIFAKANMYEDGLALEEITNNTDKYDATSNLYAGYGMLDNRLGEKFRLVWGVRVESFRFNVNTFDFSGLEAPIEKTYLDILPSFNLTYNLTSRSNFRLSGSRTVSRPEFREVANFSFYDFVRNVQVRGNVDLERSQNTNADFRFETYPSSGEIISASVFVKHFDKPIELRADPGSNPLNIIFAYYNAKSAFSYGIEAEIKKRLSFLGDQPWLDNFSVFANAALIKSSVNVDGLDIAVADKNRPMQGQSPYMVNAGLSYANSENNFSLSALFNRIGHRVEAVGFDAEGLPDIYENGRSMLDVQISKKIIRKKGELKLNISDILNQRAVFYQNYQEGKGISDKRSYNKEEDRVWNGFRYGTNFSLSFSYNF